MLNFDCSCSIDNQYYMYSMLVLIAVGMVMDVARAKRVSTRDLSLTVVPSPTDLLLVLLTDGIVQALNPSLPPCHLHLATEPHHSFFIHDRNHASTFRTWSTLLSIS